MNNSMQSERKEFSNKLIQQTIDDNPIVLKTRLNKQISLKNVNQSNIIFKDYIDFIYSLKSKDIFKKVNHVTNSSPIASKEHFRLRRKIYERVLKQFKDSTIIPKRTEMYKIMDQMFARSNGTSTKYIAYMFRKIWKKLYRDILQNGMDTKMKELKENYPNDTIVFVPTHRSYIDFIILSYVNILYRNFPLPHIIAGEDFLQMLFVSDIMRHCGALFMKRQFNDLPIYKAIFKEYILTLLEEGNYLEFFIEGTRSRNGKTYHPKFGILGLVLDAYFQKRVNNVIFVPVYFSYEKMLEQESHVREMLGEAKKKETTKNMIFGFLDSVSTDFGDMIVNVGEEISLKDFIKDKELINNEMKREICSKLGYSITKRLDDNFICMSTHIISSLLLYLLSDNRLNYRRTSVRMKVLIEKIDWLKNQIKLRNTTIYLKENNSIGMIERILNLYSGHLEKKGEYLFVKNVRSFLIFSIYKNALIHLFIKEAIICCSLHSFLTTNILFENDLEKNIYFGEIDLEEWRERCHVLGELLHLEIHPENLISDISKFNETLEFLKENNLLTIESKDNNKVIVTVNDKDYYEYVCSLIWPHIETYSSLMSFIYLLAKQPAIHGFQNDIFVKQVNDFIQQLYYQSITPYFESVSVLTIKNAISRFISWKILHKVTVNQQHVTEVNQNYIQNDKELLEWWNMISLYTKYKQSEAELISNSFFEQLMPPSRTSKL
ncbi:hypothetical protein ABK040_005259 [Willaertia magna]